jgi:hypothetical protein
VSLLDVPPSRLETLSAYGAATLATLVWVGCVIPGARLADASAPTDAATPMARGAILILPALVLFVTGSVGTVLAHRRRALRGALAFGEAFVALYMAGAVWWGRVRDPGLTALVAVLAVVGLLSVRDGVRALRAPPGDDARAHADLRLAISLLVLATPVSLLAAPGRERASLLAPFAYVALSAGGARLSRTVVSLRLTAAVVMTVIAAHLVVAIHYALEDGLQGSPPATGLTWAGHATVVLATGVLLLALARVAFLVPPALAEARARRAARAAAPPPTAPAPPPATAP